MWYMYVPKSHELHAQIQRGGGQGVQTTPEKSQKYRASLQYWSGFTEKLWKITTLPSQYSSARQRNALVRGIWLLSSTKKPSKLDPLWQNFLHSRMSWSKFPLLYPYFRASVFHTYLVHKVLHYRPRICPANLRFMCVFNALYVRWV